MFRSIITPSQSFQGVKMLKVYTGSVLFLTLVGSSGCLTVAVTLQLAIESQRTYSKRGVYRKVLCPRDRV